MCATFAQVRNQPLSAVTLVSLLTGAVALHAQSPRVAFADRALHFGSPPGDITADSGQVLLVLKVIGVPTATLGALTSAQVIIADPDNSTYTPQITLAGPIDMVTGQIIPDPRFVFMVPTRYVKYELRLPGLAVIPFTAVGQVATEWTYR